MRDPLAAAISAGRRTSPALLLPVTVVTVAPLTVRFPDQSVHAALLAAGSTASTSSGKYVALHQSPLTPIVIAVS